MSGVRLLLSISLLLSVMAPPCRAQYGECKGVVCADGFQGCRCDDPDCCRRRLERSSDSGSVSAGRYDPAFAAQMAVLKSLGTVFNSFIDGMRAQQQQNGGEQAQEQQIIEAQQAQVAEAQARLRAQQEQEAAAARAALAAEMKEQAPDLDKPLDFKNDEPAPKPKRKALDKYQACRDGMPHLAHAQGDDSGFLLKSRAYLKDLAGWEHTCGRNSLSPAIESARSPRVGAALAYDSRVQALFDEGWIGSQPQYEIQRLVEARQALYRQMSDDEKRDYLNYRQHLYTLPPMETEHTLVIGAGDLARWTAHPSVARAENPGLMASLRDKASRAVRWAQESPSRAIAELAGMGIQNDDYGQ